VQLYELVTHAVQCHQASCAELGEAAGSSGGELDSEAVAAREDALVDLRDQVEPGRGPHRVAAAHHVTDQCCHGLLI
jgi:hypothetical protein